MASVKVVADIGASADAVWGLFQDFGGITRFSRGIESCSVEGEGVGAVRTLTLAGGVHLQERLESLDNSARSLSYAIIGENPLPFDNYLSTVRIAEKGPGCTVEWSSTYEPTGPEEQVASLVESIYRGGIGGIKKLLE